MSDKNIEWLFVEQWGRLGVRMYQGQPFVHCQIEQWSPSLRKKCVLVLNEFKEIIRLRGHNRMFSLVPMADSKVRKWQLLFGQKEIISIDGNVLYMQEI